MPGFYEPGEYDLAGFAVGVVDRKQLIDGKGISAGDAIIGIASSGIHSNGYSLVRKVLFDAHKMGIRRIIPEIGVSLSEELLRPTRIYVKAFNALNKKIEIRGMAHITGGGIPGNLPRVFPKGLGAEIFEDSWPIPPVFDMVRRLGKVPEEDMRRTFNMGLGYMVIIKSEDVKKALGILYRNGYESFYIGNIKKGKGVRYA
jgi:phosphoribosylformylglycinamidine cyclo-ligase